VIDQSDGVVQRWDACAGPNISDIGAKLCGGALAAK